MIGLNTSDTLQGSIMPATIQKTMNATCRKIDWNAATLQVTNTPDAAKFIRREYRQGWVLDG